MSLKSKQQFNFVRSKGLKLLSFFCAIFTSAVILFTPFSSHAQLGTALSPFRSFGGKIESTSLEFCIIPIPTFPFILPFPFRYIEVGKPSPAKVYAFTSLPSIPGLDLLNVTREYSYYNLDTEGVWALGTYLIGADKAFRSICLNGGELPDADGGVNIVGTSN